MPVFQSESAILSGGGSAHFPYRFLSVAQTGQVAVSDDGITWVAGVSNLNVLNTWSAGALNGDGSLYMSLGLNGVTANIFKVATSQDGDTFNEFNGVAVGKVATTRPVSLYWTNLFNAGRWYAAVLQDGASPGGVWYSDDDGVSWLAMAFAGAPAPNLNPNYFAVGRDRLFCMGNFFADGITTNRIFYSTDGVNMLAGPVGITDNGLWVTGDGNPRLCVWVPDFGAGLFVCGGSQVGAGSPVGITSADGTAVTSGPFNLNGGSNSRCGNGVYMSAQGLVITPFISPGVLPGTCYSRSANGTVWIPTVNATPPDGECFNTAYSNSLSRAVGCQHNIAFYPGGFVYTDDGTVYTNTPGPAVRSWYSIVSGF